MHRLLDHDDVLATTVDLLGPIGATHLRASCSQACAALTRTEWAQGFWRAQCMESAASIAQSWEPACWYAAFCTSAGESVMRAVRTQRLQAALLARGLRLRPDSWLCAGYISRSTQVGSLEDVVKGVETMAFLFRETRYAEIRHEVEDDHWQEACDMAEDAADDALSEAQQGERPELPGGEYYQAELFHLPLSNAEVSERAKRRAVEEWAEAAPQPWERGDKASSAPEALRERVAALLRGEPGWWGGEPLPPSYAALRAAGEAPRARGRSARP